MLQASEPFLELLQLLLVKQAQQFQGYLFGSDTHTTQRGRFKLAFACTADALRFCHSMLVVLMYKR